MLQIVRGVQLTPTSCLSYREVVMASFLSLTIWNDLRKHMYITCIYADQRRHTAQIRLAYTKPRYIKAGRRQDIRRTATKPSANADGAGRAEKAPLLSELK